MFQVFDMLIVFAQFKAEGDPVMETKFVCRFEYGETSASSYKSSDDHAVPKLAIADKGVPSSYQSTEGQATNPSSSCCPLGKCRFVVATALVALLIGIYVAYHKLYAAEPNN